MWLIHHRLEQFEDNDDCGRNARDLIKEGTIIFENLSPLFRKFENFPDSFPSEIAEK